MADDPILTLAHDIGPKRTRFRVVVAIRIDDEIMYVCRSYSDHGEPRSVVRRGREGTTAVAHEAGAEIEFIAATISPEQSAAAKRYGRFVQYRTGRYPHSWEDPSRQDWPEMNP